MNIQILHNQKWHKLFNWKSFTTLALALLVVGGTAGCGKQSQYQQIKNKKTLTVATSADYAPFEFPVMKNGHKHFVGLDMMICQQLAKSMGVKLKVNNMEFPSILNEVKNNKVDMAIGGIVETKQRQKAVDFSNPYFKENNVLLVKKADANNYNKLSDVKGKEIGAQQSSTQVTVAKRDFKGEKLVQQSLVTSLATDLKSGKLNGIIMAKTVANQYVKNHPDQYAEAKMHIKAPADLTNIAIALPKNQPELKKKVNKEITHMQKTGQINQMYNKAQKLEK